MAEAAGQGDLLGPGVTPEEVLARIDEDDDEIVVLEPRSELDKCLVGVVERFNSRFVVYSKECVLQHFRDTFTPDPDDDLELMVREHYGFNVLGAWIGDGTPAFLLDDER